MTTVTQREVPARVNGARPMVDSPAVSAPARARIPVTQSVGKISGVGSSIKLAARRWWGFTARPSSLRAAWRLSVVDAKRIPGRSGPLGTAWRVSNATDRLLMFALILAAPTAFTGPLRWIAARPTRRLGFYLVAAALAVTYLLTRKG
jgi:hypothetical protein